MTRVRARILFWEGSAWTTDLYAICDTRTIRSFA